MDAMTPDFKLLSAEHTFAPWQVRLAKIMDEASKIKKGRNPIAWFKWMRLIRAGEREIQKAKKGPTPSLE
jgi:hypothetical protein